MSAVKLFWDPQGFELDSLGEKKFLNTTDGDTPFISVAIRLLSVDTPEVHYPGNQKPSKQDENLKQLAEWISAGKAPINADLAQHLHPKLDTGKAGTLQENLGIRAAEFFNQLLEEKLKQPNGSKRNLFVQTSNEKFDQYGRLLAYIAPSYTEKERSTMTRAERATFNLMMIESGWGASFPIYPSLPAYPDLALLQDAAKKAFDRKKGAWENPLGMTGYEFRACIRLFEITKKLVKGTNLSGADRNSWMERYCVDMTTREIYYPQDYHRVKPFNRIFVWSKDVTDAVSKLNLVPAE